MNSLITLIQNAITLRVITAIDNEWVVNVRSGRLQDDPTSLDNYRHVLVHPNDPNTYGGLPHVVAELSDPLRNKVGVMGMYQFGEIGIGLSYMRRFTVEVNSYFVDYERGPREDAMAKHNNLLSIVERAVLTSGHDIQGLTDDFGENCSGLVKLISSYSVEGGGDDSFIWRGFIQFETMTQRGGV